MGNTVKNSIRLGYLYPNLLNIYGDRGNVLCLQKRCQWRGIDIDIEEIDINEKNKKFKDFDLFFIGGGQDAQQERVSEDLINRKNELKESVEAGAVILAICGGYQMLGSHYQTSNGEEIPGLGILQGVYTKAPSINNDKQDRLVGNVIAKCLVKGLEDKTLVGFENHSGRTFIESQANCKPLAQIIKGHGNNGEDGYEGVYYKNVFGTYLHGSLLPKNPHFADELITRAIKKRHPDFINLSELDDKLELEAHKVALSLK